LRLLKRSLSFCAGEVARQEQEISRGGLDIELDIERGEARGAETAPCEEAISRQIREYKKRIDPSGHH
jgi:hypothetical protein